MVTLTWMDGRGAGHVQPAIGILGLGFGHALEGVLGTLQVALQQHSNPPVIPALSNILGDNGSPIRFRPTVAELQLSGRFGHYDNR